MPDWSYHPIFKPLCFRLRAESARRLVFGALELQSRAALGRWVFRLLSGPPPPPSAAVERLGLRFPSPVGLGAGLNPEGRALDFLQDHFGFGYLELGPVGLEAEAPARDREPLRVPERRALVLSGRMAGPGAAEVAEALRGRPHRIPWGVALRGDRLGEAAALLEEVADFFTLPWSALEGPDDLGRVTAKPRLLRVPLDLPDEALVAGIRAAQTAGVQGAVVGTGEPSSLLEEGEIEGPFLMGRTLACLRRFRELAGEGFVLVGAGGAETPEDAAALREAGADLVQVRSGFVYAGPGLPLRMTLGREAAPTPQEAAAPPVSAWGARCLAFTGWALIASGLAALALAATIQLLPPDLRYLGMTVQELCDRNACRIVHFMAHDRVSFGGSILSIGLVYHWMALGPLRRGEAWAWWAFLFSGLCGFASFLTYLGYGYLDPWHGLATLALLPVYLAGMALTWRGLRGDRHPRVLLRPGAPAWIWSPAGLGRLGVGFAAFGMLVGGLTIMGVGMTRVFVPTDLEYMGVTIPELKALNPRLVPLIAHDRAGFGGGLFSGGLAIAAAIWCGTRPGERALWWALLLSGLVGFGTAIGVHPIVGYTSFIHLLPAYLGFGAFLYGMAQLRGSLCLRGPAARFPDL